MTHIGLDVQKVKVKGHSVQKLEWKHETYGRMDIGLPAG